jgi:hypothetical protein
VKALKGFVQVINEGLIKDLKGLNKVCKILKRRMKALIGLVQAIDKGLQRLMKALRGLVQAIDGALFRP